jgi:hypothetical protein
VYDNGFRLLPGAQQAVEILNFVERVTATPVNQPDVRIGQPVTVEIQATARIQEHIHEPCHRDVGLDRIDTCRQV